MTQTIHHANNTLTAVRRLQESQQRNHRDKRHVVQSAITVSDHLARLTEILQDLSRLI